MVQLHLLLILLRPSKGVIWREVPQLLGILHEYSALSYLKQAASALHRSWRSGEVLPNEVHE